MRLISKIHDYYDGVVGSTSSDRTYTFVRETRQLPSIDQKHGWRQATMIQGHYFEGNKNTYEFRYGIMGFCGKLHPFIQSTEQSRDFLKPAIEDVFYTFDQVLQRYPNIEEFKKKRLYNDDMAAQMKRWLADGTIKSWHTVDEPLKSSMLLGLFAKEKIAYFVVYGTCCRQNGYIDKVAIELYPVLEKYKFFRVHDAYQTFQQIEMYLTNELVKRDEINIIIPDDLKAQSKGFDKWSFRKMPKDKKK